MRTGVIAQPPGGGKWQWLQIAILAVAAVSLVAGFFATGDPLYLLGCVGVAVAVAVAVSTMRMKPPKRLEK